MRVLFDGYWWIGGPPSGRMLARELVLAWSARFPEDEVHIAVRSRDRAAVAAAVPGAHLHALRLKPHAAAVMVELGLISRYIRAEATITHNFTPLSGRACVFIQDVLFQTNPEWFGTKERIYLAPIPLSARRAQVIFASSASEAKRIHECNPRLRRVVPVGLGVSTSLTESVPEQPVGRLAHGRFVLSVGRLNVRKNLGVALEAAARAGSVTPDSPLVVVGEKEGLEFRLPQGVESAAAAGEIVFLGSVSDSELRWLYENARALVYVSRDEGFGLPPVEALTFGCPVIVSDIPVFRETMGGGAAIFVTPEVDEVAEAFDGLEAIDRRRASGYAARQGACYTWPAVASAMREEVAVSG